MERTEVIKALEWCNNPNRGAYCPQSDCPYGDVGSCEQLLRCHALSLIKELTEENERLRAQNETLEIIEKDLRFRNKELQKYNEGLAKNIEELEVEGDKVREAYAHYEETTGLKQVRADTVRKMQELIEDRLDISADGYSTEEVKSAVLDTVDQIAKEMEEI